MTRVNELLRREIGTALFRLASEGDFDISAVTVTHVITSPDLRTAQVLISIRGHESQRKAMLATIRKNRVELQAILAQNVILKYTPRLSFSLDESLEKGDRVLDILRHLEPAEQDGNA